jgi:hypothetical protein
VYSRLTAAASNAQYETGDKDQGRETEFSLPRSPLPESDVDVLARSRSKGTKSKIPDGKKNPCVIYRGYASRSALQRLAILIETILSAIYH